MAKVHAHLLCEPELSKRPFTFETPRLRLREFRDDDADDLLRLNADLEVLRYTGDTPFGDAASAEQLLRHYASYEDNGLGRWALERREDGKFLGFCGLRRSDRSGDVDLGLRLFPEFWSHGYATEAGRGALEAGFRQFGLPHIVGRAMRENLPSITILQKLGMKYRDMIEDDGEFWLEYIVTAERFMAEFVHRQ